MKKQAILLSLAALGMMVGANAFASRATELVNGTGDAGVVLNGGSLYYDDAYNMFYNPSYINDFKNWATIEKSNFPGTEAQGGFVASMGGFNFGLYLNRGNAVVSYPGTAVAAGGPAVSAAIPYTTAPIRPVELFIGGDAGVKWGLGITHASNTVQPAAGVNGGTSSYWAFNVGAQIAGLDPFFTIAPVAKDSANDNKQVWWRAGARYHFGEWTPYVVISQIGVKNDTNAATEVKEMTIGAGLGRSAKIAEGIRMNYALAYFNIKDTQKATDLSAKRQIMPIDFSVEGDALSWLTLRAGLQYRLMDRISGVGSVADDTKGRFGGSVHFTKAAHMDFAVGNSGGAETATSADGQTFGFDNGLFTAANFTYNW